MTGRTGPTSVTTLVLQKSKYSIEGAVLEPTVYNMASTLLSAGTYLCQFQCMLYFENVDQPLELRSYIGPTGTADTTSETMQGTCIWPFNKFTNKLGSFNEGAIMNQQVWTFNDPTTVYYNMFFGNNTGSSYFQSTKLIT